MTTRITNTDLENVLNRYKHACDRLGLLPDDGSRVGLDHGSKTYGRAFRVFVTNEPRPDGTHSTGHGRPPAGDDFLGFSKREAFDTLADRAATLEDVAYRLEQSGVLPSR